MRKFLILPVLLLSVLLLNGKTVEIARDNIHLREGPGCFHPIKLVLNKGARAQVLQENGQWLKIQYNDQTGWISHTALESVQQEESLFSSPFEESEDETVSSASVSAAVRGFARKYINPTEEDVSFLDNYDKMVITVAEYQQFKRETFHNRNYHKIKTRYRRWNRFKSKDDFHITNYLEKTGLAVSAQIAQQGLINDQKKLKYLNNVGTLINEHSELYYYPAKFFIVKDERPAAYATPIGMIFITNGLLDFVKNEAELACLLGHELSHVIHKHGYREIKARKPRIEAQNAFDELEEGIPGEDTTAAQLSKLANQMYEAATAKRQIKYEYQADKCGAVYAYRAGYDPQALNNLLVRIKNNSEMDYENFESNWESFYIKDRIEKLEKFIDRELDRRKNLSVINQYRFQKNMR